MLKTLVGGSFSFKIKRKGKVIEESERQKNIIVKYAMSSKQKIGTYLNIGTGTNTPTYDDTALQAWVARHSTTLGDWVASPDVLESGYLTREVYKTFIFSIGTLDGNFSEIGLSNNTFGNNLQTRALFVDGNGDPTTVTVTSEDQLEVTYYLRKKINMNPTVTSIIADIDGTPTTIDMTIKPFISANRGGSSEVAYISTMYCANAANYYLAASDTNTVTIDPVTYLPTTISTPPSSDASNGNSPTIELTATGNTVTIPMVFGTTKANGMEWRSLVYTDIASGANTYGVYQIEFDGPNYITKTDVDIVTFNVREVNDQDLS